MTLLEVARAPKGFDTKPQKNGTAYHKGKDGKWYSYQDLSVANRRYLQAKFELDKIQEMNLQAKKDRSKKKKRKSTASTSSTAPSTPLASSRRSARLQLVSPSNPKGLSDEELAQLEEDRQLKKKYKPSQHRVKKKAVELTEEDRARLQNLPDWMEGLHEYLLRVDNVSDANCRNVMKQVEKMATGVGITYHCWREGTWFKRGTKIDLSFDFDKLYDEAVDMENKHGRDKGNGWLMRHPIVKLKKFQQHVQQEKKE